MSIEAKICGLSTPETLDAAVAAGAALRGLRHLSALTAPYRLHSIVLKALGARVPARRRCASACSSIPTMR